MGFQQVLLAILTGASLVFGLYYLFAVIFIHKKIFDKNLYFVIGCFACSLYIFFDLLKSLPFTEEKYLLFHRLKFLSIIIIAPFYIITFYECFFPNGKKYLVYFLFFIAPFTLLTVPFNILISLPIKTIEIETSFSKFIYHVGTSGLAYFLWTSSLGLVLISSMIYFIFSKTKGKRISFLVLTSCGIPIVLNDTFITRNIIKSIYLGEYYYFIIIAFIFIDFLFQDRKAYLSVVSLSKELQKERDELEIKVEERTKEVVEQSIIIKEEKAKVEELLHNVLPIQIVKEYNEQGYSKPVLNENATIVFTDFVSFSKFAEDNNPQLVVDNLDKIFSKFDDIVKSKNLEKLKTIGDSYMFAGGLFSDNNQLEDSLQACFEMIDYITKSKEEFIKETGYEWALRVGIHTGPVVTGLIGKWRFLYDTWGNTVNIASRLEGASDINRINTSKQVYDLLNNKNGFAFEYRGTLPIKNMNPIEMYFVNG